MSSKRFFAVLILTLVFLTMLPLSGAFAADVTGETPQPAPDVLGPNLLTNPGMDGKYVKQCAMRYGQPWVQVPCPADYLNDYGDIKQWETVQVPFGWSAWWQQPDNNFDDPNYYNNYPAYCPGRASTPLNCIAWHNPEFRDTLGGPQETGPSRKVAGDNSQKYFTFYSVHNAGMYQVVSGVKPGDHVRFSVYMEAWSTGTNDPYHSDLGQRMNLQVGIDPTGGNNPWSPNIVWTAPADSFDVFTQFTVDAIAQSNTVSVWTRSNPQMPLQHNDVYVDEASLNVVLQSSKTTARTPVTSTRRTTTVQYTTRVYAELGADGISRVVVTVPVVTAVSTPVSTRSTGSTPAVTSPTSSTPISGTLPIPDSGTYTVMRGDTLIAIARRFGILPWWHLGELNNLTPPYRIEPGQILYLR